MRLGPHSLFAPSPLTILAAVLIAAAIPGVFMLRAERTAADQREIRADYRELVSTFQRDNLHQAAVFLRQKATPDMVMVVQNDDIHSTPQCTTRATLLKQFDSNKTPQQKSDPQSIQWDVRFLQGSTQQITTRLTLHQKENYGADLYGEFRDTWVYTSDGWKLKELRLVSMHPSAHEHHER